MNASRTLRRRRFRAAVAATVVAMVAFAGCSSSGSGSDDDAPVPTRASHTSSLVPTGVDAPAVASRGCQATGATDAADQTLQVGGGRRTWTLFAPVPDHDTDVDPSPLIVVLHGAGQTGAGFAAATGLDRAAPQAGMTVVAPDAQGSPALWQANSTGADADFVSALIDTVTATRCIDLSRVALVGFSVGGTFAAQYGCANQDRIAVLVTAAAEAPGPCDKPMPVIAFHGTADPIVAYAPAPDDTALGGGSGTEANMAAWAKIDGCDAKPKVKTLANDVRRHTWGRCDDAAAVVLYEFVGGGHEWPPPDRFDAASRTIAFVRAHPRS
ncbi:MAG: alpha/beta fold hydrolase [Actinobacteria bacterium]|nr:alpha/beta fold hydrolase [Actinomycetota bacterium]